MYKLNYIDIATKELIRFYCLFIYIYMILIRYILIQKEKRSFQLSDFGSWVSDFPGFSDIERQNKNK